MLIINVLNIKLRLDKGGQGRTGQTGEKKIKANN
jgi:hypothetical protein